MKMKCPGCDGTGVRIFYVGEKRKEVTCPDCQGTGMMEYR